MIKCDKCGEEIPEGTRFCINCGAPLDSFGTDNKRDEGKESFLNSLFGSREKKKPDNKKDAFTKEVEETQNVQETSNKPEKSENKEEDTKKKKEEKKSNKDDKEKKSENEDFLAKSESPYLKPKKASDAPAKILFATIIIVLVITAVFGFFATQQKKGCLEDWVCGTWSDCKDSSQTRNCIDSKSCGTKDTIPVTTRSCGNGVDATEPTITDPRNGPEDKCSNRHEFCNDTLSCCKGFCVHNICQSNSTYCGDGYCDSPETCTSCPYDCGKCPGERDLTLNVFTEPLGYFESMDLIQDNYVRVSYFYSNDCPYCTFPADIEKQLRFLAADVSDLAVFELIDVEEYPQDSEKYLGAGPKSKTPFIRIESNWPEDSPILEKTADDVMSMTRDGDITGDIYRLICSHSSLCGYVGGKIMRL